ncbi:hypothetical protein GQ607_006841 [Colletotrichum asianum]|uniref:Heterokaryon incompatibility domain-containing protein n=1 Tax=Colletotrichum asianum TaxID=702518 RepID=A0A8H3WDJ9_9PEZI|nr:hypothetical protein GQ607_006841 [Colletotrichum asianum]
MINWHSSACRRPDVMFLDDIGAPSCLNCGEIGAIDEAPSANAPNNPPETPQRAGFELRWPASLSFTEDGSGNDDSTEQSKPNCPAAGEMFVAGETLRATDVGKHTTASAEMSFYEPLHARKIRILQLLPGEYGDPVRCNIRTVDLQFKPEYEALSYTWADSNGDASLSQRIYIGERYDILRITANCANALRRLRFPAWSRDLWVDAVCIDQNNIYERSHQVGIMRYIYATAKRVLVYLGEDAEDNGQDPAIPWKYENQGNTLELNTGISHRPYFTRTWIIQEIASARSAWIICGSRGMRWQDFVAADAEYQTHETKSSLC